MVKICTSPTSDAHSQLQNPVLSKSVECSFYDGPHSQYEPENSSSSKVEPPLGSVKRMNEEIPVSAIASSPMVQKFLQRSLHFAVDELFASGTVQQLMDSSLNQVTAFDTAYNGSYDSKGCDIHKVPTSEDEELHQMQDSPATSTNQGAPKVSPRLNRSKICHQKSSIGVVLGSIWVRTSTLKVAEKSSITAGKLEVITSFIFYPASWLSRVGLRYGTEANLQWSPTAGWKFNVSAVKAVPENSLIFDFCREGNIQGVMKLFERGDASMKDTSPKGWTPLHVSRRPFFRGYTHILTCLVCSCFRSRRALCCFDRCWCR